MRHFKQCGIFRHFAMIPILPAPSGTRGEGEEIVKKGEGEGEGEGKEEERRNCFWAVSSED